MKYTLSLLSLICPFNMPIWEHLRWHWKPHLDERCSKAEAIKKARRLNNRYGKTKIGRLVFDTDEILDLSDAMTPEEKSQPTWT